MDTLETPSVLDNVQTGLNEFRSPMELRTAIQQYLDTYNIIRTKNDYKEVAETQNTEEEVKCQTP